MSLKLAIVEDWIRRKLDRPNLFTGITTHEIRRERIRAAILDLGLEHIVAGREGKKRPETWGALFQRLYGQPLRSTEDKQPSLLAAATRR